MLWKAPASRAAPGRLEQPPREREVGREGGRCRGGHWKLQCPTLARVATRESPPPESQSRPLRAPLTSRHPCALWVTAEKFLSPQSIHTSTTHAVFSKAGLSAPEAPGSSSSLSPKQAMSSLLSSRPIVCLYALKCPLKEQIEVADSQAPRLYKLCVKVSLVTPSVWNSNLFSS